ncbi:glycyl-tRNA synthetase beta chain [Anaerosphaera aminiphila DSM 21120]|uniref:Glycine--tRNA ligase beta subunit n=1 Tax=Anaerosphaera aminiphila DSM 21120 TaxID=1120995 RepID=A0A1M5RJ17_9FIRM|nr:glycine--tRNA ligase subunit beta [Anaerosphaera aminiphila]SHH26180.1 glycyl-tRNA synthetase beta chain [Anaerosphaera aminiphila DSM 21120]
MNKYLLEIGVEELPARLVEMAISQLRQKTEKLLADSLINFEKLEIYATPRRLSLIIDGVELFQEDINTEAKGPSKKISFDSEGNPTKPLLGFINAQGINVEDIIVKDFKGEDYVYANIHKKGDSFENIIKENIAELIKSINFPKSMKWGGKNIKFARPIRWIVSILNSEVIKFDFEGIPVSNITRGHRFLGKSSVEIDSVDNYEKILKDNFVILKQDDRKEIIKYGSNKLARSLGGEIHEDDDLLEELTYIVEYPNPIMGRIKDEYLELPKEVITTPMRDHLRFMPIYSAKGDLLPYFITIRNGNDDYKDIVIAGNEKVLEARLEDAKFFYKDDISKPLEDYVDSLKGVMFQDKLGTMYDKSKRIGKLSEKIGEYLEVASETVEALKRASELSKADLTTKLVQEFTELQGKMGSIYAEKSNESDIVCQAIFEQYLPRYSHDSLPKSTTGSILAIADKLDTIVGMFSIGLIPTGSQDPFGLRRSAIGIINIIESNKWKLSIEELIDYSMYVYVEERELVFDYNNLKKDILEFFRGRVKTMLQEKNIRYDIIDAVINLNENNIVTIFDKSTILNEYFKVDRDELIDALLRVHNISKKFTEKTFSKELLTEKEELKLYDAMSDLLPRASENIKSGNYSSALDGLSELISPINDFFDNIMILVDDEAIKNNRLTMIKEIDDVVGEIFDVEKIVTS